MKSRFVKIILGCALCISLLVWGLMYYVVSGRSLPEYTPIQFLKLCCEHKEFNPSAIQCILGDLYLQMGRRQWCGYFSLKQAVEYYRQSAAKNEHVAFYRLGECYLYGYGVKPSREKAIQYFQKATAMGCFRGATRMAELTGNRMFYVQAGEFLREEFDKLNSLLVEDGYDLFFERHLVAMHFTEKDFYDAFPYTCVSDDDTSTESFFLEEVYSTEKDLLHGWLEHEEEGINGAHP